MVYTFLISIVFIAEIIIAVTIIKGLLHLDKLVLEWNSTVIETQSGIKDIAILAKKISEQYRILATDFVEKTKKKSEDMILKQISKILISVVAIKLNFKFIKKIRKSKFIKILAKGWSLVENMV